MEVTTPPTEDAVTGDDADPPTVVPPPAAEPAPAPSTSPPRLPLPETGTGERAARRRKANQRRLLRTIAFTTALVVLFAAIPVLGWIGVRTIRDSKSGRAISAQNDPTKPRYEANVVPTPVMVAFETDANDNLVGAAVMTLGANDDGGALILVPADTLVKKPDGTTDTLANRFAQPVDAFRRGPARDAIAATLGVDVPDVAIIPAASWAQWLGPVLPLTVTNPDKVTTTGANGKQTVRFAAGPVQLTANDVADYVQTKNTNESDLALMNRQEAFWSAWLAAIKSSSNPNVVPGETTSGFGRYVRGLGRGQPQISLLPVHPQDSPLGEFFTPDPAGVAALVRTAVPLPTAANPGARTRVRLLSGTGPVGNPSEVASRIVGVGAELTIIGNADNFDYGTTQIIYYDDQFAAVAAQLQQALGVGTVTKSPTPTDTEDVTIILGKDADATFGGTGG